MLLKPGEGQSGVIINSAIIVKIKKMFNIKKFYTLNMYRAFLTIDKFERPNGVSYTRGNS
jgi:hypothetical protein